MNEEGNSELKERRFAEEPEKTNKFEHQFFWQDLVKSYMPEIERAIDKYV